MPNIGVPKLVGREEGERTVNGKEYRYKCVYKKYKSGKVVRRMKIRRWDNMNDSVGYSQQIEGIAEDSLSWFQRNILKMETREESFEDTFYRCLDDLNEKQKRHREVINEYGSGKP